MNRRNLLDELTSGMIWRRSYLISFAPLMKGKTLLLVTHHITRFHRMKRVALNQGKILQDGETHCPRRSQPQSVV
jgi:ABC-type transport system involved in cytochrome bd biosynthesis fused ATPase/permease subunit